ncbi:MAG: hypothetical protein P1V35_18030, partial [Planctomycetota bacterium]|nr:hypothetical protein [Planctomycetota bacterium]
LRAVWASGPIRFGRTGGEDATMLWAKMVVWAIPIAIGLTIVLNIALNVFSSLAAGGRSPSATTDERDRKFQLRGMCVTTVIFGLGFVGALVGLSTGWTPLTGIIAIYLAATVGDLVGNLVRIVSYRLGS